MDLGFGPQTIPFEDRFDDNQGCGCPPHLCNLILLACCILQGLRLVNVWAWCPGLACSLSGESHWRQRSMKINIKKRVASHICICLIFT
jgi:hypothetical protein